MARLSARDASRLARTVNRDERRPIGGGVPDRPRRANTVPVPKALVYLAAGVTIPARTETGTGMTPGSGTATFCLRSGAGWTQTGGRSGAVHNTTNAAVSGPGYCQAAWVDGLWCLDVADC